MRVLYLAASPAIGGGARSLLSLFTGLERAGVVLQIVCPAPGLMLDECRRRNVTTYVRAYDQPGWRSPFETTRLFRQWLALLGEAAPDVVHANDFRCARAVALAARAARVPLVCHVRFPPGAEYCRWAFRGLPKPAVFVLTSRAIERETTDYLRRSCPSARQTVVYNAVDVDVFKPRTSRPDGPVRVGIVANLSAIKRHIDFFAMAKLLLDGGRQCEFWVVGDDISGLGYREHLAKIAEDFGITRHVRFLGFQTDIHTVLHELDIVVSTSDYESFGRSLIEAMAAEIPVVGGAVGGIPEIIEDGKCGFLVPVRDPAAFANAVEQLVASEDVRREMGRVGRSRVLALFTAEAHAQQMIAVYQSVSRYRSRATQSSTTVR